MKTLSILCALLIPALATAEAPRNPLATLEPLVGDWKGPGSIAMGKDKAKVDIAITCKHTSASAGILCAMHATGVPGIAAYEETDLFGYEPNSDSYHWFAITNAGETHDHAMKNPGAASKFQWTYSGTQDGKPMKEVVDFDLSVDKTLRFRAETFVAGASISIFEGRVRK